MPSQKALTVAMKTLLTVTETEARRLPAIIDSPGSSAEEKEKAIGELSSLWTQTILKLAALEDETALEPGDTVLESA